MSICPTHFGRANRDLWQQAGDPHASETQTIPWQMLQWQEQATIERGKASHLDQAHRAGKITIGEWITGEADE